MAPKFNMNPLKNPMPAQDPNVRNGNFQEVALGYTAEQAIDEAKRCVNCKNKPCVSVSTLEALAYNLKGYDGIICPVMNARRNQVYNALFEWKDGALIRLCPDRAMSISELDEELADSDKSVFLCGDGYDITEKGFEKTKISFVPERQRLQSAYSVACIAYEKYSRGESVSDAQLVPIYLRPSQAERERNERLGLN